MLAPVVLFCTLWIETKLGVLLRDLFHLRKFGRHLRASAIPTANSGRSRERTISSFPQRIFIHHSHNANTDDDERAKWPQKVTALAKSKFRPGFCCGSSLQRLSSFGMWGIALWGVCCVGSFSATRLDLAVGVVLCRPRSFEGGDLHWLWKPYSIYQNVDLASQLLRFVGQPKTDDGGW